MEEQNDKNPKETQDQIDASSAELTDEEAEKAFAEGLGEEAPAEASSGDDETTQEETTSKTPKERTEEPPSKEPKTEEAEQRPSYEDLEKALADTKAWGTRLSMELADLRKTPPVPPTKPEAEEPKTPEMPDDLKKFLDDYPEMESAVNFFAERIVKERFGDFDPAKTGQSISELSGQMDQFRFERAVMGGFRDATGQWINGHPDAYEVMATPAFQRFYQAEVQRNPVLLQLSDPAQSISLLTRYKEEHARTAAAAHDAKQRGSAEQMQALASGAPIPGNQTGPGKPRTGETPEEIFRKHSQ